MRVIGWCLLAISAAAAQDSYPILVYPVPRAASPPVLDGVLGDPCWAEAPVTSGFTWYNKHEPVPVQTTVRWVYDDEALYLGVWCDEPLIDQLHPQPVTRDSHQVFSTEAIEIFIEPAHNHIDYYQLAVNAAGSLYDSRKTDPSWESGATAACAKGEQGWSLELRLPWAAFGVRPATGMVIGANVCRDRTLKEREWSNWSQTNANFHDPVRFAHLVLSPTAQRLAELTDEFRKGERSGPLHLFTRHGIGSETYAAMAGRTLARVDGKIKELREVGEQEGGATKEAIERRLAEVDKRLEPLRAAVAGEMDGGGFSRTEAALNALLVELSEMVWEARLEGLLATL